ncbi:TOM1-like protein 1 [Vigna radiata var. radiata]|uniref:TOM1-like protein 1 n=1 Tax=Vigna radiata var. radiata TaxID=3916 RepID=A0A3Q0FHD1_VIGRR|nr:TOM1-like protein 1 [Vigna radiata var. radiata]
MSENLMGRVNALGERLKIGGAEVGRKMSAGMSSVSFKVKEFFQDSSHADKLVGEATSETLPHPHWPIILHLCDLINGDQLNTAEAVRAIKKRVASKSHRTQYLALVLLEALVKNCDKAFLEVATERVLDEMVKLVDDPYTFVNNRNKALMMIEAWGESTAELRYLPVYAQTFKSLKSRGILFPSRDNESLAPIFTPPRSDTAPAADVNLEHLMQHNVRSFSPVTPSRSEADVNLAHLMHHDVHVKSFTSQQTEEAFDVARNSFELLSTVLSSSMQKDVLKDDLVTTLVQQCRQSQTTVHRIIETSWDNEALLCEALNINDEIEKVVKRYEEMKKKKKHAVVALEPETAIEAYEAPHFTEEEALVRKSGSSRSEVQRGNQDDMLDDLDEMIFGKRGGFDGGQHPNKQRSSTKDDLISF